VPEDVVFKTKPQIALDQIKAARAEGVPEGVVLADAGYGIHTAFRTALTRMGLTYVVGIQSSERPHMPGSSTTPGRPGTRDSAPVRVVFRDLKRVDTQRYTYFAAQWLACALPCRRFALILADENARLGAEAGRYAFLVMDLHHLLPAGLSRRTQIKC
jgi:DDE superfamily endonuclease